MSQTLRRLLWSSRLSWVNTAFPFAASYWVASGRLDILWVVGTLYFLIPYNLLRYASREQYLNRSALRAVLAVNLPFLVYLFLQGGTTAKLILAGIIFIAIAYGAPLLRLRERPLFDSMASAAQFAGPMLYGIVLTGWDKYYLLFVLSFFFWGMASHAFGAVQKIPTDHDAGVSSVATFLGARWTVRFSAVLYLVACELLLLKGTGPMIVGVAGLVYVANILPFWDLKDAKADRAARGWKRFVRLNYFVGLVVMILLLRAHL